MSLRNALSDPGQYIDRGGMTLTEWQAQAVSRWLKETASAAVPPYSTTWRILARDIAENQR